MFVFQSVFPAVSRCLCKVPLFKNTPTRCKSMGSSVKTILGMEAAASKTVKVQGWVKSVRKHKELIFLDVVDGTSLKPLQVTSNPLLLPGAATYGSAVEVEGTLASSVGSGQDVELLADSVTVVGKCDPVEFPFKLRKKHPLDYVRQFPHLRPRTNMNSTLLRLRNAATCGVHEFFQKNGYIQVHTPIISSNDCEGAGEVFQIEPCAHALEKDREDGQDLKNFFGVPAFLTVSGQLHLEVVSGAVSRVYTFNPAFRAENSRGRLHLSEFYMVEAEIAFIRTVEDLNEVVEDLLKYVSKKFMNENSEDINFFFQHVAPKGHEKIVESLIQKPFIRLPYSEAVDILLKSGINFQIPVKWGCDFQKEHERHLVAHCGNVPVFVMDFPATVKPFYSRQNDDTDTVAAVDLLAPDVGEICGGTLREERLEVLEPRIKDLGLNNVLQWYLDLRRFGSVPHGGFGIGFERYLQAVLGISNIKDAIPFPRSVRSCKL